MTRPRWVLGRLTKQHHSVRRGRVCPLKARAIPGSARMIFWRSIPLAEVSTSPYEKKKWEEPRCPALSHESPQTAIQIDL